MSADGPRNPDGQVTTAVPADAFVALIVLYRNAGRGRLLVHHSTNPWFLITKFQMPGGKRGQPQPYLSLIQSADTRRMNYDGACSSPISQYLGL